MISLCLELLRVLDMMVCPFPAPEPLVAPGSLRDHQEDTPRTQITAGDAFVHPLLYFEPFPPEQGHCL